MMKHLLFVDVGQGYLCYIALSVSKLSLPVLNLPGPSGAEPEPQNAELCDGYWDIAVNETWFKTGQWQIFTAINL